MILTTSNFPALRLRSAQTTDAENLRCWKNKHKQAFFLKTDITPKQQQSWITQHLTHKQDFMFMVEDQHNNAFITIGLSLIHI